MKRILLFTIGALFLFETSTFAGPFEGYDDVDGYIDLSICGDGITEGDEDCEIGFPILEDCTDIGYDGGSLSCDVSCSYNIDDCFFKEYVPPIQNIKEQFQGSEFQSPSIPSFLVIYDLNGDGEISLEEYCTGLLYWVNKWKLRLINPEKEPDITLISALSDTCDLNRDKNCDLVDFSIFLYNAK